MLEEKEEKKEGTEKRKGSSKKWIIIVIVVFIFLAAAGGAAAVHFLNPFGEQAQGEPEEPSPEYEYVFDSFVVNLAGQDHRRYLKVTMTAAYHEEELQEELESKMPEIRNDIIDILRSKSLEEVQKEGATREIRRQVVESINSIIKEGSIQEIYLTDYIIQ